MGEYYMAIGVDKNETGSFDTFYDNKTSVDNNQNYAYLGIRQLLTPQPYGFTYPSASKNDLTERDLQMYTPYPTGTERGKLYLVAIDEYASNFANIPRAGSYATLHLPENRDSYYVITPTLNDSSYNTSYTIAQYAFADIDDLWDNGYKITGGTTGQYDYITTKTRWDTTKTSTSWKSGTGWDINSGDPNVVKRSKEQIAAAMFACTSIAYQIQSSGQGISDDEILHGAMVVAGEGSSYDNATWNGIIPITGSIVANP